MDIFMFKCKLNTSLVTVGKLIAGKKKEKCIKLGQIVKTIPH